MRAWSPTSAARRSTPQHIPLPDRSVDLVTIAFGLRNVTDKDAALREMHRVLKPGGRALVLEFSQVTAAPLKPVYDLYSFQVLPRLGAFIARDAGSYQYLAESIRKHPDQETLKGMMEAAGFARCTLAQPHRRHRRGAFRLPHLKPASLARLQAPQAVDGRRPLRSRADSARAVAPSSASRSRRASRISRSAARRGASRASDTAMRT